MVFGEVTILNMAIGCRHTNKVRFSKEAGIMGLIARPLSIVYKLPIGGSLVIVCRAEIARYLNHSYSDVKLSQWVVWVPMLSSIKNPSFYYVWLTGLGVGGIQVPIFEDVFQLTKLGDG